MSDMVHVAEKEIMRKEIMTLCSAASVNGCSMQVLTAALKKSGYNADQAVVERECAYLADKGLIRTQTVGNARLGVQRNIAWITAEGTDYLDCNTDAIAGIAE
ncbi:MAG: hypothetical protein HDR21_12185 [Lachnospiraceae bacterium]|nr:hypothetical protein [Lachnospiraceae bacterium]